MAENKYNEHIDILFKKQPNNDQINFYLSETTNNDQLIIKPNN
jgi:hypothetical protein